MQPDTIINLIAGGALAALLARLLQQQYEARIADYKERIKEQSGLLGETTSAMATLQDRIREQNGYIVANQDRLDKILTRLDARSGAGAPPGQGD